MTEIQSLMLRRLKQSADEYIRLRKQLEEIRGEISVTGKRVELMKELVELDFPGHDAKREFMGKPKDCWANGGC